LWRAQDNPSHTNWKHGARGPEAHLSTRARSAGGQRDASSPCPHVTGHNLAIQSGISQTFRKWVERFFPCALGGKGEGLLRRPSRCPRQRPAKPKTAPTQAQECAQEASTLKPTCDGNQDDSRRASRWRGSRARAARQRRGSRCQMIFLMRGGPAHQIQCASSAIN
jgi:hypothetical protein